MFFYQQPQPFYAAPVVYAPAPAARTVSSGAAAPAAAASTPVAVEVKRGANLAAALGEKLEAKAAASLAPVLDALGTATAKIADSLRGHWSEDHGHHHKLVNTTNTFGDQQLAIDVVADKVVFDALKVSKAVSIASSEETAKEVDLGGSGYSVAFDPLDGSSIIDANFAVGSIYGVWPGRGLVGRTGDEQVVAAVAMYGPRTTMAIGIAAGVSKDGKAHCVEVTLADNEWHVSHESMTVKPDGKVFAPGNLRATSDNPRYRTLVEQYISERFTLRYSGGMVPDVYHILVKGKGVFTNVSSDKAPAKLRILYEAHPVSMIMVCAGADAVDDRGAPMLARKVQQADERTGIATGSKNEIARFVRVIQGAKM